MAVVMTSQEAVAVPGFTGGYWNKPYPKTPPPPGTHWQPVLNADGTRILGWKAVSLGTTNTTGGSSAGGGYGYGSGGGAGSGLSAYIQAYRIMFGDPKATPPKALLQKAKDGNWSTTYWQFMVRQTDPKYFRSAEAQKKMSDLRTYMRAVGVGLEKGFAKRYLREGWSATQLQSELTKLKGFKEKYPDWAAFAKAQRAKGAAKQVNPLAYQAYQTTFRNAFKQGGIDIPEGWERSFFKSGITDDEFIQNFSTIGQTQAASQWDLGGLDQQQTKSVMFSGAKSAKLRAQLQQALNKQQNYFKKPADSFGVGQQSGLIQMRGI